jgi:hypothetical protein
MEVPTMPTFNKEDRSFCPQCGSNAAFKYCGNSEGFVQCVNIKGAESLKPHMHRACRSCGYRWTEVPAVA